MATKQIKQKKCPCCNRTLPLCKPYWYVLSESADGFSPECSDCMHGYRSYVQQPNLRRAKEHAPDRQCSCCGMMLPVSEFTDTSKGISHVCNDCKRSGRKRMVLWPLTTRVPFAEQELPFDNQPKHGREYEDGFTTANGVRGKIVITIPGKFTVSDVLSVHKQVTKAVQRITDKEIKW